MLAVCVAAKLRAFLFIRHGIGRLQAGKAVGLSAVFQFEPPRFFGLFFTSGEGLAAAGASVLAEDWVWGVSAWEL